MKFLNRNSTAHEWAIYWQQVGAAVQKRIMFERAAGNVIELFHLEDAAEAYRLARWWVTQIEK